MNMKHLLTKLFAIFAIAFLFNACVEDDDFDVPEIPPVEEIQEIISEGGDQATFVNCLSEDFQSYEDGQSSFTMYENVSTVGTRLWNSDQFNGEGTITLSAFNAQGFVYTYFVIPVNFDEADAFSFATQDRYWNGDPLKVKIVTNYSITDNIAEADIEDITGSFAISSGNEEAGSGPKVPSGSFDLSSYSGNGFIAFKYEGSGDGITTTIHIDDIVIVDNEDDNCAVGGNNGACFSEEFSYPDGTTAISGSQNITVQGSNGWNVASFGGESYLFSSAFETGEVLENWFIQGVDFDVAESMSFETLSGFANGDVLSVQLSTDYDFESEDPTSATWTDITDQFEISNNSDGFADSWTESGEYTFDLEGQGFVAFVYNGDSNGATTAMELDDIQYFTEADGDCVYPISDDGGTGTTGDILISEVADPADNTGARFVELYNPGESTIDLSGWSLLLYSNANTEANGTTNLTGTIAPGETYIIADNATEFEAQFSLAADIDGSVNTNGNDNFELVDGSGNVVDAFGVPGEDGTGTDHDFVDGRAVRNADVITPNTTYDAAEWTITQNVNTGTGEYTPGSHPDEDTGTGDGQTSIGGDNAMPTACLTEDFTSFANNQTEFADYENVTIVGDRFWEIRTFGGNQYIQNSAFNGNGEYDSWFLVNVDFDNADTFSFNSKDGYYNGDALTVLYSTTHSVGQEIVPADWTDITSEFTIASGSTDGYPDNYTASGEWDLSSVSGSGFIAFRYQGNSEATTTTMQVDDITIVDNEDSDCTGETPAEVCFTEDYESFTSGDTELPTYQNVNTASGTELWEVREFSANKYIQMSAFNTGAEQTAWYIMGVNFDDATGISFDTKDGFNNGDPLTVWYSTDYDEQGDPSGATWEPITDQFTIATGTTSGYAAEFTPSGMYEFTQSGNGYIAFRYDGADDGITTTIQVDNIELFGAGMCKNDLPPVDDGSGPTDSTLLISEIADPANNSNARYVEIYNAGDEAVDLTDWILLLYANANPTASSTNNLEGSIAAGETYVIANNAAEFETEFGFAPDLDGNVNSNGNDNFELVAPDGTVIDVFGVPGEDGEGTDHDFEDGRAVRNADIMMPNSSYTASEWTITLDVDTSTGDYTPGSHPDEDGGGDPTGIIQNGDFESWTGGVLDIWTTESGTNVTEENTIVDEGTSSARFEITTGEQGDTDVRQAINVEAGITYDVSFRVYQEDNKARARLFFDGYENYSDPSLVGEWQDVVFTYTAETTGSIDIGLRFYDIADDWNGGPSIIYVDNFQAVAQ